MQLLAPSVLDDGRRTARYSPTETGEILIQLQLTLH
jgi:hypothetical protein